MSSELVLNWGIISCGNISQDFCTALRTLESKKHNLVACAARNMSDSENFAKRFNVAKAYDSYDDLLADENVNIVYIGSITIIHKELSIKALNAGKHVICEKPMAMNSREQEEVFACAKLNKKFFMEAIWTRHFPFLERLKQELKSDSFGNLRCLTSNFMVPINKVDRVKQKELGGGATYDIGIYPIQLACFIFNDEKPIKITASGHLMETGVDESCSINLLYSDGRFAVINYMSNNTTLFAPTHIVGDKGVLEMPHSSWCPSELILPNGEKIVMPHPECPPTNFGDSVGLRYQAEGARQAISKGLLEHPNITHDNSRLICHIMDEARKQMGYIVEADSI